MKEIRSVSFDTSFLLKDKPEVNIVIKKLKSDMIDCYLTSTVVSELEQLKLWERIDKRVYRMAISRWRRVGGKIINFKNKYLSAEFRKECIDSMNEHHGVKTSDIVNDCNILIVTLKNGVDLFLSEDFHFTSKITLDVLDDITNNACAEYQQMCGGELYCMDTKTFLDSYNNGSIDLAVVENNRQNIRKPSKLLGRSSGDIN